ncbi:fibrocystin-L, partial [Biomphalaria glabrata]
MEVWKFLKHPTELMSGGDRQKRSMTKVLNISPQKGSRNGGTRITVKGVNFSKSYFSFGQGNENLGSKVWLTSLTSYPCDIHPDGSHQSQITCYTVPMPVGKYTIKVSVDGVDVMETDYCPLTTDCQFTVTDANTPTIDMIRPASGLPGAFLEVSGTLVTTRYAANEPNETQTLILRVYFGGQKCELRDFEKDSMYGISVDVHGKGYFKCKTEGTYIGNHNISFLINNNYGRSLPSPALKQVHRNGIGMYQTFTEINGLSVSKGSRAGGTQLKITGKYFDETDSPVEVYVGDKPCKVLSPINDTEITCVTPEESNVLSHFSGNRGMFVFLQKGITDPFHLDKNEATVEHIDESTWSATDTGPHAIQMVGYFVPAYTGHYSFCLKAAARAYLYLSLSSNPNDKTLFFNGSVTMCTIETSNTVRLEADRKYYMEVYYGASTFASYVTVATILSESPYSQEMTGLAEHEKQEITITSATLQEVQALHISSSGNPGTISPDVQMITIEGSTLDCSFVLGLNGAYTVPIRIIDMTSSSVQKEIKTLPSVSFPVSVAVNFGSSSVVLTLTSSSPEGDINLFDAIEIGKDKHLSFSVKKLSRGRPTLGSYTLELAGVKTSPIDVKADKLKLQQSLLQLFSVRCHPIFYGGLFVMSFETVASYAVSDVEPFCGRYSSKNFANVIKRTWINGIRISLINSKYMCFAYKGSGMIELVKVQYGFNDVNSQIKTIFATFHVSNDTPDEWSYWCEDVLGLFKSVVAKGFAPRILNVWISTKNAADLYVDEVLFTKNSVLETIAGNFKLLRMSQARLNGTFIDAVTVQGNFPSFNIILKPHHCGQNIPLLGVAYASFQDNAYVVTNEGSLTIKITSSVKASPPIEGTFSIRFKGEDSGPIAIDSSVRPDNLYSALSSMSIGVSKVEALGICSYRKFVVTMISLLGNQPVMEIDSSHLTGLNVLCNVKTIKDGGLRFEPITGDFLRSYHTTPQVFALINNVPTKCAANSSCTFEWEPASTPSITEIQPTSGSPGTFLEIIGTGFDVIASNNEVQVGNSTCSMQTSTESKITCVVGSGSAGSVQVSVSVKGKGLAIRPALFTYTETILSMLPLSGSAGGGTLLTITGNGFINSDEIKIDGNECTIQSLSATQVTCRTPTPNSFPETSKSVNVELVSASNTRVIGSFTYNPDVSFTPTVSSISTFETTTWGKKRFTISGKGFGNIEMPVMIGNIRSTILSYYDTAIVAILPSLPENTYKLIIDVAEKGYADLRKYSIPDIKYTFNVLSLSPNFGSLYGGTDLVITGNGFSLNSSQMSVAVGTHQCNIIDLTDTSIKCRIEDTGKYHTVSATGIHKLLGYGYAWDKDPITIQVGDYITWTWQTPQYVSDIAYSIQQTATAFDAESLPDGFSSGNKSRRGTFTHQFTASGTYYYWTGYMDNNQTIYFRGKVTVYELQSYSAELSVQVLGVEAKYTNNKVDQSGSASEQNENTVCKDSTSLTDSCLHGITLMLSPNKFYFHFFKCFSPFFVSTSKNNGSFSDVIAITGSGFGESLCQNEVFYASQPCSIQSVDSTKIEFTISSSSSPPIGMSHPFQVRIKNYGYALFTHSLPRKNRFVLWPKVSHISPTEGSKVGGTIITVVGAGFVGNPQLISVQFDSLSCVVKSVNYNKIICETRCGLSCNAGVQKIQVYIPGHDGMITAECTGNQCSLFTTESFTALVTSVVPEIVDSDSTTLKVSGNHFLSSSTSLAVYIGEQHCSVIGEITNTDFACIIGRLPVGPNEIKVYAGTYGLAFTTKKVTSKAVATITIPVSASIYGGAMMVIDGNGFTQQTSVKVDSTVCSIVKTSLSQVKCILPAHAEGSIPVSIISNNVQYSPLSLSYSQTSTPKVTSISPDSGQTNTEITITGTGFDSPAVGATPEVKIGGVACTNVRDTSATSITCTTGPHNTGVFVVQVFVEQKGFSNMDQTFTYQLASFTLTPLKGSTNGGQLVTLTGSGFLQGKTSVTICGSPCQEVSLTTLQYICKTAAVNDTPSSCDVVAAVDKVSQTLASVYAYDSSLASSVTLVSPSRGGTAGGTLVTITGSGFGISNESLSVKIAGVICDVQSVINSEIKCITGPSASIVSEVEVNVNNQGIAKQVNAQFEYIDVWSNPFTWGGQPQPEDGDFIVIPANQTILLDTDTAVLKMLLIQ